MGSTCFLQEGSIHYTIQDMLWKKPGSPWSTFIWVVSIEDRPSPPFFSQPGTSQYVTVIGNYVCLFVNGCCSAHRQDRPHVYYTKRTAWATRWCTSNLFFGCYQIWPPGGQKTAFLALAQPTDKIDPKYIIPKWPATWIFLKLFKFQTSKSSADGGHLGFSYFWL